jgi:hypothetical protein
MFGSSVNLTYTQPTLVDPNQASQVYAQTLLGGYTAPPPVVEAPVVEGPTQEQIDTYNSLSPEQQEFFATATPEQIAYVNAVSAANTAPAPVVTGPTAEQLATFYSSTPEQQEKLVNFIDSGGTAEQLQHLTATPTTAPAPIDWTTTQPYQVRQDAIDTFYGYQGVPDSDRPEFEDASLDLMNMLYGLEKNQPEMFNLLLQNNPQAGALYYSRLGDSGINYQYEGYQTKEERQTAQELASFWGSVATGGDKNTAVDYSGDVYEDVTREWEYGDAFKIGTTQTPMGGLGDFIEHNPVEAGFMVASMIAAPAISGAIGSTATGALVGGSNTLVQGGSVEDIIKSAATGALTSGMLNDVLPGADLDNFAGAFARGTYNELISTGIMEGELASLDDMIKSGGIQTLTEIALDVFTDADQTKKESLDADDTVNGKPMTQADIERLTDTSDMYGLLGDNGLLTP